MKTPEQIREKLKENQRARAHFAELAAMVGATQKQKDAFKMADQAFVSGAAMLNWVLDEKTTNPA